MNEVINNIMTRRSIRAFNEQLLTKEQLETLINAGLCAPSGMGKQTWKFTGILNQEIIKKLATTIGDVLGREDYNFYHAKALIITTNESTSRFAKEDNACALENIFLAAHSMGIGSVWINQMLGQCDVPSIRAILDEIGVPKDHEVFGIAALGYDENEPKGQVDKIGQYSIIE
ncbi:MAG: nitroreductase family protein [Eubacteriales bacterium]